MAVMGQTKLLKRAMRTLCKILNISLILRVTRLVILYRMSKYAWRMSLRALTLSMTIRLLRSWLKAIFQTSTSK